MLQSEHATTPPTEPRWRRLLCFLLMMAGLQLAIGPRLRLSQWHISAQDNPGVAEGDAWLHARLDIPQPRQVERERMMDTAAFQGRCYNVFPPLVSALTVMLSPLHQLLNGRTDIWLPWPYVLLCFWPLPILAFLLFRRETGDAAWGGLLAGAMIGGTALAPSLAFTGDGNLVFLNHILSEIGLLIMAIDLLGRQRIWPALIGLLIAVWSRQLTLVYALPLIWIAWRKRRIPIALVGLTVIVVPLLILNHLKFGSIWDTGYQYIYVNRSDWFAQRCREHGLFSPHFIAENAWFMHVCPPRVITTQMSLYFEGDAAGTSIWITTPLLLFVVITAASWWRDPVRRSLILASLLVMAGLLCYHSTGCRQPGYHRFALDFLPIWFAVVAPYTRGGWRSWLMVVCTVWSLLYFSLISYS